MSIDPLSKQLFPELVDRPKLDTRVEKILAKVDHLVMDLHTEWKVYKQLFGDATQWGLFERNGSVVFRSLRRLLADSILLAIARLADPKDGPSRRAAGREEKHENLGVRILVAYASRTPGANATFARRVEARRDQFLQQAEPFIKHRNKRIAHNDARLLLRESSNGELVDIEVEDVDLALRSLRAFLNEIHEYFHVKYVDYDVVHEPSTDGVWLVRRLQRLDALDGIISGVASPVDRSTPQSSASEQRRGP
jgi:hypothetical protein